VGRQLGTLLHDAGFVEVRHKPDTVPWQTLDGLRQLFDLDGAQLPSRYLTKASSSASETPSRGIASVGPPMGSNAGEMNAPGVRTDSAT
jgi:hypothetical protein